MKVNVMKKKKTTGSKAIEMVMWGTGSVMG